MLRMSVCTHIVYTYIHMNVYIFNNGKIQSQQRKDKDMLRLSDLILTKWNISFYIILTE